MVNNERNIKTLDEYMSNLIPKQAGKWVNLLYSGNVNIIKDIVYPNTITPLRPGKDREGVKMPGGPQYIVIHDTGMTHIDDNADGLSKYIHAQANSETGRVASWHFSIDDKKAYQHIPTDEIGWHAGDGSRAFGETKYNETSKKNDIGGGNRNGIGIETCINPDNDYELTLKRTAKLTSSLLLQYGLGLDRIKQHYDFSSKYCPNVIRSSSGLWDIFLKDVEGHYLINSIDSNAIIRWENSNPNIIKESGKIVTPKEDTEVELKCHLTFNGQTKVYTYKTLVKGLKVSKKVETEFFEIYYNIPKIISSNITLPNVGIYNSNIIWKSNNDSILSSKGKYNKPNNETKVTLTAMINLKGFEKTYNIKVKVV